MNTKMKYKYTKENETKPENIGTNLFGNFKILNPLNLILEF